MQWFALQPDEVKHMQGLRALTPLQRRLIMSMVLKLANDVDPPLSVAIGNVSSIHKAPEAPIPPERLVKPL